MSITAGHLLPCEHWTLSGFNMPFVHRPMYLPWGASLAVMVQAQDCNRMSIQSASIQPLTMINKCGLS